MSPEPHLLYFCNMAKTSYVILVLSVLMIPALGYSQMSLYMASFTDESRDRTIGADIFYPSDKPGVNLPITGGPFPVVVFGHGMAMPVESYRHFVTQFIEEEYIVVLPKTEMGMSPEHNDFSEDIAFVTKSVLSESKNPKSPLYNGVKKRFAAVGHSMGGGASFWAATHTDLFETIVAMAPAEFAPAPSSAAAELNLPVLIITGTNDGVTSLTDHIFPIYNALDVPCKQMVAIKGGSHCGFSNSNWLCNMGEKILAPSEFIDRQEQHNITYQYMMPWLEYYLKDQCLPLEELKSTAMADERVEFLNDCHAYIQPCAQLSKDLIEVDTEGMEYTWLINDEEIPGERIESISTDYGSGVYRCEIALPNGCVVESEPIWYHGDRVQLRGEFQYRIYTRHASEAMYLEVFGVQLPLDFTLFTASGDEVLRQTITANRQDLHLPGGNTGLLFYSLQSAGKTLSKGKFMRQ